MISLEIQNIDDKLYFCHNNDSIYLNTKTVNVAIIRREMYTYLIAETYSKLFRLLLGNHNFVQLSGKIPPNACGQQ